MIEIRKKLPVSVIIPAHNEADNIKTVICATRKVSEVDEILVVNDGSTDETVNVAKKCGVKVISIIENKGKGRAMKIGGARAKGDVLVFLDADLQNITPKNIRTIIDPFRDLYDFVKTRFDRREGRVTELTAKPLLGHFFPEIEKNFSQPLSGQIGIRKNLFKKLALEDDYGVDVGMLIDVVESDAKTKEVYFGRLKHHEKRLVNLNKTAKQVSRVILDRAAKYNKIEEGLQEIRS